MEIIQGYTSIAYLIRDWFLCYQEDTHTKDEGSRDEDADMDIDADVLTHGVKLYKIWSPLREAGVTCILDMTRNGCGDGSDSRHVLRRHMPISLIM